MKSQNSFSSVVTGSLCNLNSHKLKYCYYIIITIVQSYIGNYHEFVAVGIISSRQCGA